MTQTLNCPQNLIEQIATLTPQQQEKVLDFVEFLRYQANKLENKPKEEESISFYEAAKEFIGCAEGGPGDLSTNKDYLRGPGCK